MCYHVSLNTTFEELSDYYSIPKEPINHPETQHYYINCFSFPKIPVITSENPSQIQWFEWGLCMGSFSNERDARERRMKYHTFNAMSETVFEKISFKNSILSKRCLIPATGFFEWREVKGKKYPYYISLKKNVSPLGIFSFAGICDEFLIKDTGEIKSTFSILTVPANRMMSLVHNVKKRMPLIIEKGDEKKWLNKNMDSREVEIKKYFKSFPDEKMCAYPVSKLISSRTQNPNIPEVLNYFDYPELNGLEPGIEY